jgi:hypothetical protein
MRRTPEGWQVSAVINLDGVDLAKVREKQAQVEIVDGWSPPVVLPPHWTILETEEDGAKYMSRRLHLTAILSCAKENDGRAWLHLSVSHRDRIPTWTELRDTKELFLGDREAYSVLPPKARYVNIHPNVLHLFALLDKDAVALPDFTHGTGSL